MKNIIYLTTVLLLSGLYAQNPNEFHEGLNKKFTEYYRLERENIHTHFSKSTYFTDEKIWISGYVFTQQTRRSSIFTNNVFVEMFDVNGILVSRHLLFSTNGIFQATLPLDKNLASGSYYFRFYTNYMNNFHEDISAVYPIEIININDADYDFKKSGKYADLYIDLFPESGVFLNKTSNVIGVKITDYLGKGVATKKGKLFDDQNNQIGQFLTNNHGYGRFEIADTKNITYRVEVENQGFIASKLLPNPVNSGIGLSVVGYSYLDKSIIQYKCSEDVSVENYFLLVSQDSKTILLPFAKDNKSIVMANESLFDGVNIARIIDQNQNVLAERMFFIKKKKTQESASNDEIAIYSYSVFNENTRVMPEQNIYNSVYVNPYTQENATYQSNYFTENNRSKNFELDLFFLNQKPKENFKNIIAENYPKGNFNFERGLSLEATINSEIKNKNDYRIHMVSYPYLNEFTSVKENNTFSFENLIIADSTHVHFNLLNKEGKPRDLPLYPKVIGNNRKFIKAFLAPEIKQGTISINQPSLDDNFYEMPGIKNHYIIEGIEIEGSALKRQRQNSMLRGYKPEDIIGFENMKLLDFLETKRFVIERNLGTTIVYSFRKSSTNLGGGSMIPNIFVDGSPQTEHSFLETIWMSHVDEIYLDRTYIIPGLNTGLVGEAGTQGLIRIYLKSPSQRFINKEVMKTVQIVGGFTRFYEFENSAFQGDDAGFEAFGNLHWESRINAPKDKLKLNIPNQGNKPLKVLVEGITSDGAVFSEIREVVK